jgi:hypothetical protein
MISCLLCLWFVGCSADDADSAGSPDATDNRATAICAEESRAEQFAPGMAKQTDSGVEVALVEAEPAPPARLDNSWVISVEDASGEPREKAQLTLNPQMPDHGHGSPREPLVKELGDGEYRAEPISLFMPGYWTVGVSVALGDEPPESVQFGFCVP